MTLYGFSAVKQPQPLVAIAAPKRRIQERGKLRTSNPRPEPPTRACYIVYLTTCALLLTLCVVAVLR